MTIRMIVIQAGAEPVPIKRFHPHRLQKGGR
jgi:hypothetical protein